MYVDFRKEAGRELETLTNYYNRADQDSVRAWIGALGPFRFTGTLNFNQILSKEEAWRHCAVFVRRFHKETLGRNWKKWHAAYQGVAVMELAPLSIRNAQSNTPHFHFLLRDHPGLPRSDEEAISQMDGALEDVAANLRGCDDSSVCHGATSINGFKIVSGDALMTYLTKQVHWSGWSHSHVRLISGCGVV